jgi:hypothetical protein
MKKRSVRSRSPDAATVVPDPRVRELYAVSPAEFIAARDELVRALAAGGSPDAARVRRLRRPSLAVWLLNALARDRPDAMAALFEAGDRLRQAQARAVRGGAPELRAASAAVHEAIGAALSHAREIAAGAGRETGAAVLGQIEQALRAVATADLAARDPLREGVLERLPEPGGIELLTGLASVPRLPDARGENGRAPVRQQKKAARDEHGERAAERVRRSAERSARAQAAQRDRERRRAMAEAERRERAHRAAEERARKAERALERAQVRAAAARRNAEAARQAALKARATARSR